MTKKAKVIITVSVIAAVIVIAVIAIAIAGSAASGSAYSANNMPLEKGTIQTTVNATGKVESTSELYVRSSSNYEIKEVNVSLGDKVKAGDVLCIIDDSKIKTQIAIAESNLESSTISANNNLKAAERKYKELLAASNGESTNSSTDVSIKNAESALEVAQENFDDAKKDLENIKTTDTYKDAAASLDVADNNRRLKEKEYEEALDEIGIVTSYDADGYIVVKELETTTSKGKIEKYESKVLELRKKILAGDDDPILKDAYDIQYNNLLDALPSEIRTARINLEAAIINYDKAVRAMNNLTDTFKDNYDDAKRKLDAAQLSYDAAIKGVDNGLEDAKLAYDLALKAAENEPSVLQLKELRETLEDCTVVAERDGTITAVFATEGSMASETLFIIEDTDSLKVSANIKEYEIGNIHVGQKVKITADAVDDVEYEGVVSMVSPAASKEAADKGAFNIEVDVINSDGKLLIGMTAKLNIVTDEVDNVFAVRYDGIGTDEENGDYILVAKDNGAGTYKAEKVYVTLGLEGLIDAEVKSDELTEGMTLILDIDKVNDGDIIKLKENKNITTTTEEKE